MREDGDGASSDPDLSASHEPTDTLERLLRRAVHAPAETPQLVGGTLLADRFRIDQLIGTGGMGAVYLAFDTTLERQVAIKLRHRDGASDRLRREAVAMARLAHPNVITVFEVGTFGDQAFVAMEYVPGTTLRAWMQQLHSERSRIDMLFAAGQGLAAAHDAGLVHRDFKPENVLIGQDGRPRVGDFGLARGSASNELTGDSLEHQRTATPPASQLAGSLTLTGAVLGTPAYMAPEQASGETVDARVDQFAFAVVAWEVLCGERPFAAADVSSIAAAVLDGPRGAGPRRGALRDVLVRALSPMPDDRYPDLDALLAAMRRATRRRWPWLVVPAVAAGGAAAIVWAALQSTEAASEVVDCADAGADITSLGTTLGAQVRALGTTAARDGADHIDRDLAAFRSSYRDVVGRACVARRDHTWSDDLAARSHACLLTARRQAESMLATAKVTAGTIPTLVMLLSILPELGPCGDATALAASPVLPSDPTLADEVISARAQLASAVQSMVVGDLDRAKQLVEAVARSRVAHQPAVESWMQFARGHLAIHEDRVVDADKPLAEAYYSARSQGDIAMTLSAASSLILVVGNAQDDAPRAEGWIRNGVADADRWRTIAPARAASTYSSAARVRAVQDRIPEAIELGTKALALVGNTSTLLASEVLAIQAENLCDAGKFDACVQLEDRALAMARSILGNHHLHIATLLGNFSIDHQTAGRIDTAGQLAAQAETILADNHDATSTDIAYLEVQLASSTINGGPGDLDHVAQMLDDARTRLSTKLGEDHPDVAQIDSNLAAVDNLQGHHDAAIARLESAKQRLERRLGPTSARVAEALFNLADAKQLAGKLDSGLADAKRAAEIRAAISPGTQLHAGAVEMVAQIEVGQHQFAAARDHAGAALAMRPVGLIHALTVLQRGRALLGLGDRDTGIASIRAARAELVTLDAPTHVAQCDEILRDNHAH